MSIRNLEHLFRPQSIAVIGASETPRSVGATVLHNLIDGKFAGAIMPVNPRHGELAGIKVYPTVASLPTVPELAVICTPPATPLRRLRGGAAEQREWFPDARLAFVDLH